MISDLEISKRNYHSKVILLGEYSIIHDGEILAVPLNLHSARWEHEKPTVTRQNRLNYILDYLKDQNNTVIDIERLAEAIHEGFFLKSTIPSGYGLGSSGAITAAIYDVFAYEDAKKNIASEIKQDLIDIESCFHGVSSGIDPLVVYLDQCIHIDTEGIRVIEESLDLSHYFIIDTQQGRKTAPLVEQYLCKAQKDSFLEAIEDYKSIVSTAIHCQINSDFKGLNESIASISQWQYEHLDFAILEDYQNLWRSTLDQEDISIKLCGAGGGGYILGYALDVDRAISILGDYKVKKII